MKNVFYPYFWLNILLLGMLFSQTACSKKVSGNAPPERYSRTRPEAKVSSISVPLEMPISSIQSQLNKNVTGLLYEMKDLSATGQDKFNLKVWKQADIALEGKGNDLAVSVPLKIRFDGKIGGSAFGVEVSQSLSADFAIRVNLISTININSEWKVNTQTQIQNYQWIEKPTLKIGVISIPLEFVADVILTSQKKYIAEKLDEAIQQQVDVKTPMNQVWQALQNPQQISEEYNTWLLLKPDEIHATPISFANKKLAFTVALKVEAEAQVGKAPLVTDKKSLPNLRTFPTLDNKFLVYLLADIDRTYANEQARKQLIGQTYTHKKRKITIKDVYLYGSDEKLVLRLDVEGSLKGSLYLSGKLVYDEQKKALVMADMDFGLDTKNVLAKTASWLFEGVINKKIQESMQIPMNQPIEEAKATLQKTLQNYPIGTIGTLKGSLTQLKIQEVLITEKSLWVIIQTEGSLKMELNNF